MNEWIDVTKEPPPPMTDVLLYGDGRVVMGWNESVYPAEDPSYCSYQDFDEVTHWMPLPQFPKHFKKHCPDVKEKK